MSTLLSDAATVELMGLFFVIVISRVRSFPEILILNGKFKNFRKRKFGKLGIKKNKNN